MKIFISILSVVFFLKGCVTGGNSQWYLQDKNKYMAMGNDLFALYCVYEDSNCHYSYGNSSELNKFDIMSSAAKLCYERTGSPCFLQMFNNRNFYSDEDRNNFYTDAIKEYDHYYLVVYRGYRNNEHIPCGIGHTVGFKENELQVNLADEYAQSACLQLGFTALSKHKVTSTLSEFVNADTEIVNEKVEDSVDMNENSNKLYQVSSGSGFNVSSRGHIVTNNHVIEGCNNISIVVNQQSLEAIIVSNDTVNDLALLKANFKPNDIFAISSQSPKLMQDVVVAGFPFGYDLSTTIKVTKGIVSSLSGLGNNFSQIQIDASIQPGNSGGPIIDSNGEVIGVAVASLDDKKIIEEFGVVPQNTNFGIKSDVLRNFLTSNNIEVKKGNELKASNSEIANRINKGTVFINCWMTKKQIKRLKTKKVMFKNLEIN